MESAEKVLNEARSTEPSGPVLRRQIEALAEHLAVATTPVACLADQSDWKLQPLKYNHPGLIVDLGVGLWAWPMPMDYDGDGDTDLDVYIYDGTHRDRGDIDLETGEYNNSNDTWSLDFTLYPPDATPNDWTDNSTNGSAVCSETFFRDVCYPTIQNFKPGYNGNWDAIITNAITPKARKKLRTRSLKSWR